jgi:hypothetical protein
MGAVRTLVNELRRRGVVVHEWPGWDGRGNGGVTQIDPKGAIIHHTGSNYGSAYPELVSSSQAWAGGGALCNFSGNADGSLTVIASGLAYHAGQGAGPSLGPLAPWRNNLNYYTVGLEIVYPGTSPMRDAQYTTAQVFAKTVADLFGGGDIERVRAHAETNGRGGDGKYDPGFSPGKTIDMAAFRRGAANAEVDVQLSDSMSNFFWDRQPLTVGDVLANAHNHAKDASAAANAAREALSRVEQQLGSVVTPEIDYERLAEAVAPLVGDAVAEAVVERLAQRLAE